MAFIEHFDAGELGLPRAGSGFAREVEAFGDRVESGFGEGNGSSGAGSQLKVQNERGVGSGSMFGSARHVDHRGDSAGLSCQNIDKLLLGGDDGLPVEMSECGADFELNVAHGGGLVVEGVDGDLVGDMSLGGSVTPVESIAECLQVAFDAGAKKVALPMSSAADIPTIPVELFTKFQTSFYADPVDAVFKGLGVD